MTDSKLHRYNASHEDYSIQRVMDDFGGQPAGMSLWYHFRNPRNLNDHGTNTGCKTLTVPLKIEIGAILHNHGYVFRVDYLSKSRERCHVSVFPKDCDNLTCTQIQQKMAQLLSLFSFCLDM